jgi:hypothetical protein
LNKKEANAALVMERLKQVVVHSSIDSLIHFPFEDNDISYYVFNNDELVFWSDNQLDISEMNATETNDWHYILLPNAHCVSKQLTFGSLKILALITIKKNYPYQNSELVNDFAKDFDLNSGIELVAGKPTDKNAVFCSHGNYLFSLSESSNPTYNEIWSVAALIAYAFAILLFLLLYMRAGWFRNKKQISLKSFGFLSISVGLIIGLGLYFNIPEALFWNKLFSPFQYASNPLLASIIHLTVATVYFLCTVYLFYFHVHIPKPSNFVERLLMLLPGALYFLMVYYILSGLIYHSSIQLTILRFNDFSVVSLWIHFLILLWGIGLALLFYKTHGWIKSSSELKQSIVCDGIIFLGLLVLCGIFFFSAFMRIACSFFLLWLVFYLPYIFPKKKNIYGFIAWWVFVFTAFVVWNSLVINNAKKNDKYKILAQNIYINGNTENDRMADILLEELDVQISKDNKITRLISTPDSVVIANKYLNENYLRGFWNKYDMRLNVANKRSDLYFQYSNFIAKVGTQLKQTHFFSVPASENNMAYIGAFPAIDKHSDSICFFMEFYPRSQFKSYSFPNLLVPASPDIQTQLDIAIAKYEHQRLVFSSGKIEYQPLRLGFHQRLPNSFRLFTLIEFIMCMLLMQLLTL